MDSQTATISYRPIISDTDLGQPTDDATIKQRLAILIDANEETRHRKENFRSDRERLEADLMHRPLDAQKAFAYFGLMLGIFPPAAFFSLFLTRGGIQEKDLWFIGVMLIMNTVSAVVGYFSGKFIGRIVTGLEKLSWTKMILLLPLVGIFWGVMAGGAGGFIFIVVGAIFGAMIGGAVGAIALPLFGIFHRVLKRGDLIETKHFLPLAFGITLTICSFFLGR
jgi:hypothetical protein